MTKVDPVLLLDGIYRDYADFCQNRGAAASEADTRANILDRLIHDVLLWPRPCVTRERHVHPGYIDYEFSTTRPILILEAKASGVAFGLPPRRVRGAYRAKISGTLRQYKDLQDALLQTQRYCSDRGIRYGAVSNGYSFLLFRAIVERAAWREGEAILFNSPKDLSADFDTFWRLFSFEEVQHGLDQAFRLASPISREYHRPIAGVITADATYNRNPINLALRPLAEKFFGDIARQDAVDVLEHCYVHSRPLQTIDDDLSLVIHDHIPRFAVLAKQITTTPQAPGGVLESDLRAAVPLRTGTVALFMGGIGAGKTTFLRRFFTVVASDLVGRAGPAVLAHLDFLGAPHAVADLDGFLWGELVRLLREVDPDLLERATLLSLCATRIAAIREALVDDPRLEQKINDAVLDLTATPQAFASAALAYYVARGRAPIVVFDNVDQLAIEAQTHLFTKAEYFAHHLNCISILVMREESYCSAQLRKQLTAYTIRPYHLSSPRFRDVIKTRVEFATREASASKSRKAPENLEAKALEEILEFFDMIRKALFHKNHNIIRLIEAIAYGNTRIALDLFNNFILSGATNTPEILQRFRESRTYVVPFHQFAKSVILGDYRYYKESRSLVLNLFDVTPTRNASHFTSLRLLTLCAGAFLGRRDDQGFVDLGALLSAAVDSFDNEDDCVQTVSKLISLGRQLLELDTRRTESLQGASAVRITSAGRYYVDYLCRSFAYLDLVWQDTPLGNRGVADRLTRLIQESEIRRRLERVELFLEYLEAEERAELEPLGPSQPDTQFVGPFVPGIRAQFNRERTVIAKKFDLSV